MEENGIGHHERIVKRGQKRKRESRRQGRGREIDKNDEVERGSGSSVDTRSLCKESQRTK